MYVLSGPGAWSGAEELVYDLKAFGRATVVGTTSGGHARPGGFFHIAAGFEASIPTGRPINPITGTDREGTGVLPDTQVGEEDALRAAHVAALEAIRDGTGLGGPPIVPAEEVAAALRDYGRG